MAQELAASASAAQMASTEAHQKLLQKLRKEHAAAGQATTKQHQAEVQALGRTHAEALQAAVRGQQTEMEQLQRDKVALETRLTSILSELQVPDSFVPSYHENIKCAMVCAPNNSLLSAYVKESGQL